MTTFILHNFKLNGRTFPSTTNGLLLAVETLIPADWLAGVWALVALICDSCDRSTLKQFRLCCKLFSREASWNLFWQLTIDIIPDSLKTLKAISDHQNLSRYLHILKISINILKHFDFAIFRARFDFSSPTLWSFYYAEQSDEYGGQQPRSSISRKLWLRHCFSEYQSTYGA